MSGIGAGGSKEHEAENDLVGQDGAVRTADLGIGIFAVQSLRHLLVTVLPDEIVLDRVHGPDEGRCLLGQSLVQGAGQMSGNRLLGGTVEAQDCI